MFILGLQISMKFPNGIKQMLLSRYMDIVNSFGFRSQKDMNTRLLALLVYSRTKDTRRMFAAVKMHIERERQKQIKLRLDWETE